MRVRLGWDEYYPFVDISTYSGDDWFELAEEDVAFIREAMGNFDRAQKMMLAAKKVSDARAPS